MKKKDFCVLQCYSLTIIFFHIVRNKYFSIERRFIMFKKKKLFFMVALTMMICILATGCSSSKSYTFNITNGEQIKVSMDTSNGYKLKQSDGSFIVKMKKEDVIQGVFILPAQKDQYIENVKSNSDAKILQDDPHCFYWTINGTAGTEYNRIVTFDDAEACVLLASLTDKTLVDTTYQLLSFETIKGHPQAKTPTTEESTLPTVDTPSEATTQSLSEPESAPLTVSDFTQGQQEAYDFAFQHSLDLAISREGLLDTMKANASDMPHANESDYEFVISYMEDNALVDWLSEAADAAFNYLDMDSSYNRATLKEQLMMGDKFTEEQAQYAIDTALPE